MKHITICLNCDQTVGESETELGLIGQEMAHECAKEPNFEEFVTEWAIYT